MERLVKGDVVVLPFPFSDLTDAKKRPALVVASLEGNDIILCQITSEIKYDSYSIKLKKKDFEHGGLKVNSWIRPNRLFTAETSIVKYKIGSLRKTKIQEVSDKLCDIFRKE